MVRDRGKVGDLLVVPVVIAVGLVGQSEAEEIEGHDMATGIRKELRQRIVDAVIIRKPM